MTPDDVLRARETVRAALPPTPAWEYPTLDRHGAAALVVKREDAQPIGAFKVRGGVNLVAGLDADERRRGIVGYSTGNHAQSLAYAAAAAGVSCTIVLPESANPLKVAAIRARGAEVVQHGALLADSAAEATRLAEDSGARLVSAGDEPALIAGVASANLELAEQAPDLDTVVVPVGSGSGAAAACLAAEAVGAGWRVVAVQSSASPAGYASWRGGAVVERDDTTTVEGLATGSGFALPQSVLRERLADFVLVGDAEIHDAQSAMMAQARILAEGAGAAAYAALRVHPDLFADQRVAVVVTGGNAHDRELARMTGGR